MIVKKLGLVSSIVFGLFLIGFVILNPTQAKNPNPTKAEEITETEENNGKKKDNKGQINAESHRSAVASYVQGLLAISDRDGGIGEQVRVIAQQQNDSKEKSIGAIDKIEKRSKIKTFLLGTDYKNLGALRSEMVKSRNSIEQLQRLVEKTNNKDSKTELQTQIDNLEKEQVKINTFISDNESKFSLFGWAAKLFVK